MALTNSPNRFGSVTRSLHWLTALLILTAIPLGMVANRLPYDTAEALALKAQVFSVHKTLGVAVFLVAAARILWALGQVRPVALHPERRAETALAGVVHWVLYISLLAVPLTGWVDHAALAGYAPILWPFGQGLPFVPQSNAVAEVAASLHWVFTKLLVASVLLHVAGAVKHHVIDRDATLRRMWRGMEAPAVPLRAGHAVTPALAALVIYAAGAGLAWSLTEPAEEVSVSAVAVAVAAAPVAASAGNWAVDSGTITFTVAQMGSDVDGTFAAWQADIRFDEARRTGHVTVTIDTTSLSLGSVTKQAKETEFFDVLTHPVAVFEADIAPAAGAADPTAYLATGTLSLRGMTLPLELPFTLAIDGAVATVAAGAEIDRRAYKMGPSYPDEASVGFGVTLAVAVTARRQ